MYRRRFFDLLICKCQAINNFTYNFMYWKSPVMNSIYGNERSAHCVHMHRYAGMCAQMEYSLNIRQSSFIISYFKIRNYIAHVEDKRIEFQDLKISIKENCTSTIIFGMLKHFLSFSGKLKYNSVKLPINCKAIILCVHMFYSSLALTA